MAGKVGGKQIILNRKPPSTPTAIVPPTVPKGYKNIQKVFHNNVIELVFKRRTPLPKNKKPGHMRKTRRMLCTANWRFIRSPITAKLYKWKKPKHRRGPAYYRNKNLIIVWDIMKADFRIISLDSWRIAGMVPTNTLLDKQKFHLFYMQKLRGNKMSPSAKNKFYDRP